jgi:hypothetical protein
MDPHEAESAARALVRGAGFSATQAAYYVAQCTPDEVRALAALRCEARPGELRTLLDQVADRQQAAAPSENHAGPTDTKKARRKPA